MNAIEDVIDLFLDMTPFTQWAIVIGIGLLFLGVTFAVAWPYVIRLEHDRARDEHADPNHLGVGSS